MRGEMMSKKFILLLLVWLVAWAIWPTDTPKQDAGKKQESLAEVKKPVSNNQQNVKRAPQQSPKESVEPKKDEEIRKVPVKENKTSLKEEALPVVGTATAAKVVALTFDHSWGNTFTPRILDTLKENKLKVTFFIMGPWAANYPEVAKRIVADGHEVGSHGFRHENYGEKTDEWIKEDLNKSSAQIKAATGITPKLFRPPNGHYSTQSLKLTYELGYKSILWNIDSIDWMNPGRDVIIDRIMKRLKPGAIVLLHASDTPRQTADALPILLPKIKAEGYKVVTVSELLSKYSEKGIVKDE
jgi:polysaccharide deacetylase family sporulation protein PdaB